MKRPLALALSAALILLSPGLPAYQAFAADIGGKGKADAGPVVVPQIGTPLSLPASNVGSGLNVAQVPGVGVPSGLPSAAGIGAPVNPVASPMGASANAPTGAAASGASSAHGPAASLAPAGSNGSGHVPGSSSTKGSVAGASSEEGGVAGEETREQLTQDLSDSQLSKKLGEAKDKTTVLSWVFDRLRRKTSNSLDEVTAGAPSRRAESGLAKPEPGTNNAKKPLIERAATKFGLDTFNATEKAYILGQSAFMFGASIYITSMPLLVKALAGTAADTGIVRMTHYWTLGLASLFAGEIVKRVPMKKVLVRAGIGRAAIYGSIGALALMGALHWGLFVGLVGANALLVAHNHLVDMDAAGANKIFDTTEKRKQAFRLYKTLRYSMLLVMPWVLGLGMDKLDSVFGAGTGPKAGFLAFGAMMGLTAWIYQTRLKMAVLDVADKAGEVAQKLSPRVIAGNVGRFLKETPRRNWQTLKIIAGNKAVLIRTVMSTVEQFLEDALFFVVLPTFAVETLGLAGFGNGLVLSAMYLGGLLTSMFLVKKAPRLEKKMGSYKFVALLSVAAAAAVIPSIALWAVPSIWVVLPVVALMKFMLDPIQTQMQSLLQEAIDQDPKTKPHEENIFGLMTVFETLAAGAGGLAFTWIFKNAGAAGVLTQALGANAPMKIVTGMLAVFSVVYLASLPFLKRQLNKAPPTEPGPLNGKSIVIVGSYLPARSFVFDRAKQLGVDIILVDEPSRREAAMAYVKPENFIAAPVFDADKHDEIIADVRAFAEARKAAGKPVDGTLAFFDAYTVLNAKLADSLGLKGHGVDPIVNTKSKDRTREVMAAHPEFATQFRKIMTEDQAAAAFRALGHGVLKPPRGAGSQFVAEIRTEQEARAQFRAMKEAQEKMLRDDPQKAGRYSVGKTFGGGLYEQFLDGPEVDVEMVVQNGVVKLMTVADNKPTEPPYFVELGDTYPSQLPADHQEQLKRLAREAVGLIGLKNGNIHLEAKMTSKGPRLIEINSRMGGDFVYHEMKQAWGVDLIELGLMAAAGLEIPDLTGIKPKAVVESIEWPAPEGGILESISPETYDMAKNPQKYGLYRLEINKKPGDFVDGPPYGLSERPINIQAIGKTYEEAKRNAERAFQRVKVKVRPKDAPPDGVTRTVYPGRADLTAHVAQAAKAIEARDREKAQSELQAAAALAATAAGVSQVADKAREAAAAVAAGKTDEARALLSALEPKLPAAEEALALAKLEANLPKLGLPPTYRTELDATPADDNRPTVAVLAPGSPAKLAVTREGSRQAPQDYHLVLDPSWLIQDRLPDGTAQLRVRKGLRFDSHGQPTVVEYTQPRLVRYFANFFTPGANDRSDGLPLEQGLTIPTSSSERLEHDTNDKILTRILMAAKGVAVPATAAFLLAGSPLKTAAASSPREGLRISATPLPAGSDARAVVRREVEALLKRYPGPEIVVKPSGPQFHSGVGVRFFARSEVDGMVDHVLALSKDARMTDDGAILVEQRLEPPAVYLQAGREDGSGRKATLGKVVPLHLLSPAEAAAASPSEKKDWNLRVLVARTPWGRAAVTGIFARAGRWGIPTNGAPPNPEDAAAVVRFDDLITALRTQHGLLKTQAELDAFEADLRAAAENTLAALDAHEKARTLRPGEPARAQTDFLGLDVMVEMEGGRLLPKVIEINDHDSGGQRELDLLEPARLGAHSREWVATMLERARLDGLRGKRLVIVGSGYAQKKFIFDRARELGIKIVLADKGLTGWRYYLAKALAPLGIGPKDHWARGLVDEFIAVDTSKHEEAFSTALECLKDSSEGKVDGVMTFWEDDVPVAARLAEALGRPYHTVNAAYAVRSKLATLQRLRQAGEPTPRFEMIDVSKGTNHDDPANDEASLEDAISQVGFPAVIKPVYGAASMFTVRVNNADEARAAFKEIRAEIGASFDGIFSYGAQLVMMQYLEGREWDADLVMQDGQPKFSSVTDNWPTREPHFVATGSSLPSRVLSPKEQADVLAMAIKTAQVLGLRDGVVHIEGKTGAEGPRLIEANGRMGGVYVRDWIKSVWGVDLVDQQFLAAAGIPIGAYKPAQPLTHLEGEFIIPERSGRLDRMDLTDEAKESAGLHELLALKAAGQRLEAPYDARAGMLVARGSSSAEAVRHLEELRRGLVVETTPDRPK